MTSIPPQKAPTWNHTTSEIIALIKDIIEKTRKVQDGVAALSAGDCNYESVFLTLNDADTELDAVAEPLQFYRHVSPSQELRDASNEADSLVQDFRVESSMRLDVFQAKQAAETNIKVSGQWEKLDAEEQRLVDKMTLDGRRAGLALAEEARDQLSALQKELAHVCSECGKNANEQKGFVSFTAAELDGVPKDVISGYTQRTEDGKTLYDITFKRPDITPVFRYAKQPSTRQRAYEAYECRLNGNVPLLNQALALRHQIANLLGYKTWADYVTEPKMVKSAAGVATFLDEVEAKLLPVGMKERDNLLAIKQAEYAACGIPFDGKFYLWDQSYYERMYTEDALDLDGSLVQEYFPVARIVVAILEIYQNLLGVRFEQFEHGETWHPDVQQFSVWDKETGFVGYCYLDLFPREGKYSHNSVWPLIPGYEIPGGQRHYPVAAMVANLAKPSGSADKPALMMHQDVVTFFHEMGHLFHELLSKTKFARFHGFRGALDFVEAPSQMLENWCWDAKVLGQISSHYESGQPMPASMISKLLDSRYSNVGLFYLMRVSLYKFDLQIHLDPDVNCTNLWNEMRESIALVATVRKDPGYAAIESFTGGYDVNLYGYLYSQVFAADMYATIFEADPLDPVRGKLYRDKVLKPGASRDEIDILEDFLGREPDAEALLKQVFGNSYSTGL
ncbi:hypothetical protein C8J56DRAFT_3565 [Mycena floridula]|nr:hypothetical protein C8J56DRAFT_3565 [Mycena floridula]